MTPLHPTLQALQQRFPGLCVYPGAFRDVETATLEAYTTPLTFGEGQTLLGALAGSDWAVRRAEWRCRYPHTRELLAVDVIRWLPPEVVDGR